MPIRIDFLSNVRDFLRGTTDAEVALDKVADSLDDMARDGDQATEKLERSFKDLSATARTESRQIGDDFARNTGRGMSRSGEAIREFRGEAIQNLSEVASSFDGTIEGVADGFQGLAGGASAGLIALGGPAAIAGAALAGVGLVGGAMFTQLTEDSEANKEAIGRWAQSYLDAGDKVLGAAQTTAEAIAISQDPARYEQAKVNARNWGVAVSDAIRAMAGDSTAIALVSGNLSVLNSEITRYNETRTPPTQEEIDRYLLINERYRGGAEALAQLNGNMATGREIAEATSEALKGIVASAGSATKEVDELGNVLYTLPDDTQVLVRADTGLASQNVSAFKEDVDGIPETVNTRAELELPDVAGYIAELERQFRGRRVRVGTTLVTPYGQEIR